MNQKEEPSIYNSRINTDMHTNVLCFCYNGNITLDRNKTGLNECKTSQYKQFAEKIGEEKHHYVSQ